MSQIVVTREKMKEGFLKYRPFMLLSCGYPGEDCSAKKLSTVQPGKALCNFKIISYPFLDYC